MRREQQAGTGRGRGGLHTRDAPIVWLLGGCAVLRLVAPSPLFPGWLATAPNRRMKNSNALSAAARSVRQSPSMRAVSSVPSRGRSAGRGVHT